MDTQKDLILAYFPIADFPSIRAKKKKKDNLKKLVTDQSPRRLAPFSFPNEAFFLLSRPHNSEFFPDVGEKKKF